MIEEVVIIEVTEEKLSLKAIREKANEQFTEIKELIEEQGNKNATKKDVWKGVALTILSIAVGAAFGV